LLEKGRKGGNKGIKSLGTGKKKPFAVAPGCLWVGGLKEEKPAKEKDVKNGIVPHTRAISTEEEDSEIRGGGGRAGRDMNPSGESPQKASEKKKGGLLGGRGGGKMSEKNLGHSVGEEGCSRRGGASRCQREKGWGKKIKKRDSSPRGKAGKGNKHRGRNILKTIEKGPKRRKASGGEMEGKGRGAGK